MADQWYYTRQGQQAGPVSMDQLKQFAASGQLRPADLVWKEGMSEWTPAGKLKELFPGGAAGPTAPPQPPPQDAGRPSAPPIDLAGLAGRAGAAGSFLSFLDLNFTRFVTTTIVKWVWKIWLVAACVLLITYPVRMLWQLNAIEGLLIPLGGLLLLVFWTLMVRIVLETIVVIFRIAEYLRDMSAPK